MAKTYRQIIFGGKSARWDGIDQGKHPLYPGALRMALNAEFENNVFQQRIGQSEESYSLSGPVFSGTFVNGYATFSAGREVFAEESA